MAMMALYAYQPMIKVLWMKIDFDDVFGTNMVTSEFLFQARNSDETLRMLYGEETVSCANPKFLQRYPICPIRLQSFGCSTKFVMGNVATLQRPRRHALAAGFRNAAAIASVAHGSNSSEESIASSGAFQ